MCVSILAGTELEFLNILVCRFSDKKTISELGSRMLLTRIAKL
jgi:hypothetical protein